MIPLSFESLETGPDSIRSMNGRHVLSGNRRTPSTKSWKERCIFWALNAIFMPLVALVYVVVVAEGLRVQMSVFAMRLYKLPVPGAGLLRQYDGFDRLDLAVPMSLMLFVAVSYLWLRFWKETSISGNLGEKRKALPVFFWAQVAVALIIVLIDAGVFYMGLAAKSSSGWSETPAFVPLGATVLYAAGLAMLGAWHADYHDKKNIEEGCVL